MANTPGDALSSLRPTFNVSELPLVRDQRSTIEALLFKFKKLGGYDTLRKQVWAAYNSSEAKTALTDNIYEVAAAEIEKDPNLLSRERGKAATLIQGAVERSGVYQDVEARIDQEIVKHLDMVDDTLREIRRKDVGEEQATEESRRGGKSDDQYAAETEARASIRAQTRARMEELARQTAELKAKIRAGEEKKRKAEEARREEEERRQREESAERRRSDRAKRKAEEEAAEAERIRARDERARKREEEREQRRQELDQKYEKRRQRRSRSRGRSPSGENAIDEKDLEAAALQLLINESKQLAQESKKPQFEFDKSDLRRKHRSPETEKSRKSLSKDREEGETRPESRSSSRHQRKEETVKPKESKESKESKERRPRSASPPNIDR